MLEELYNFCKKHKDEHKSCGGEPYKSYDKLASVIKDFTTTNKSKSSFKFLEVGTAVGFTSYILSHFPVVCSEIYLDTIEFHQDHVDLARENIQNWGGDVSKINFHTGDAKDILPSLSSEFYDLIFFDGYGAKLVFYKEFERLLSSGGLLITANKFLKSTEIEYFTELENTEKWAFVEDFADTKIYRKK